jgi:penicillin amidase
VLIALLAAAGAIAGGAVAAVRTAAGRGRPLLDGVIRVEGVRSSITVRRDADGVVDIEAADRHDAAFATGFVHAQDRFFQMDLSRRIGAGELAELFGAKILPIDRMLRVHRLRQTAEAAVNQLDAEGREFLAAYTAGVNGGLRALRGRPFEYFVATGAPAPWREVDTLLVACSLFLQLQDGRADQKYHLDALHDVLPPELCRFLAPVGDSCWDAPMIGSRTESVPVPGAHVFSARTIEPSRNAILCEPPAAGMLNGSNCWAIAGTHTVHGAPLIANDMHLPFGMPNPFFRVALRYRDAAGRHRHLCGFTVPGYPLVMAGSNGDVSWGLTNSGGDWADVIRLNGCVVVTECVETIRVRGRRRGETLNIRMTPWGPIVRGEPGRREYALRWVAHNPAALNLEFRHIEEAPDAATALNLAPRCGIPAQNFHVVDRQGSIGWTIAGRIPRRERCSRVALTPETAGKWHGWLDPAEYPRVLNPPSGRIWTANSRVADGADLEKIGCGFYVLGARAAQIRDALHAMTHASEDDFLALQRDNRALLLERWRRLLLEILAAPHPALQERHALGACVRDWSGRAAVGCVGYRAVRAFRYAVKSIAFEPYITRVRQVHSDFDFDELGDQWEAPLWRIVCQRPPHLLPSRYATWDAALVAAADAAWRAASAGPWGEMNRLRMQHPFSKMLPLVSRWLDMPSAPLDGDLHMPLSQISVHGPVQRMVVAPGREDAGIANLAGGQASNPRTPYFGHGHDAWIQARPTTFLPGPAAYQLTLTT